jgi:hypothetical protein
MSMLNLLITEKTKGHVNAPFRQSPSAGITEAASVQQMAAG